MAKVTPESQKARIIAERADLQERISSLMNFVMRSEAFSRLDAEYQRLLKRQLDAMDALEKILGERLERV